MLCNYKKIALIRTFCCCKDRLPENVLRHVVFITRLHAEISKTESVIFVDSLGTQEGTPKQTPQEGLEFALAVLRFMKFRNRMS